MKSKDKDIKQAKLSKTAKVTLPFFALFGGQGFASSRNPLTLQSSKTLSQKAVVFIDDKNINHSINNHLKITTYKSPFSAFTKNQFSQLTTADIDINRDSLRFLNENKLFRAKNVNSSDISGQLSAKKRKNFNHTFNFAGNSSNGTESCTNVTGLNFFRFNIYTTYTTSTYFCAQYTTTGTGTGSSTMCLNGTTIPTGLTTYFTCSLENNTGFTVTSLDNLNACQTQHQQCAGHINLPVELQKFEIE